MRIILRRPESEEQKMLVIEAEGSTPFYLAFEEPHEISRVIQVLTDWQKKYENN